VSATRALRATRIAELRERAVREAQGALAGSGRALASARAALAEAERTWSAHADRLSRCVSPADLADASAYLGTLRRRAEQARQSVITCQIEEERMRAKVQSARMEQRKIELWRDGIVESIAEEDARRERVASDELAARMRESAS
jgi:flagellar biosynthesis chaperone FliJ